MEPDTGKSEADGERARGQDRGNGEAQGMFVCANSEVLFFKLFRRESFRNFHQNGAMNNSKIGQEKKKKREISTMDQDHRMMKDHVAWKWLDRRTL